MAWKKEMAKDEIESSMFRELTDTEEQEFRDHARSEYEKNPDVKINDLWHPVVRQELRVLKRGM